MGLGDGEEIMEIITAAAVGAKNSIASFSTNSRYDRPPSEGDVPTSDFSGPGSHLRSLHAGWSSASFVGEGLSGELMIPIGLRKRERATHNRERRAL